MFVASEEGIVVSLDLTVDDELRREGIAREIVRNIQDARKNAGLEIMDRIVIEVVSGELPAGYENYVFSETLSSAGKAEKPIATVEIDEDEPVKILIAKA